MDLTLILTHDCQLRCSYCYAGEKKRVSMKERVIHRALERAFHNTPDEKWGLHFFGGEPLLQWQSIPPVVERFHQMQEARNPSKVIKTLTTNGLLLDDEKLKFLKEQNFFLGFSMDGHRSLQDYYRPYANGSSSFQATLDALKKILQWEIPHKVMMTVNPERVKELPRAVTFLAQQGVNHISLNLNHQGKWNRWRLERLKKAYRSIAALLVNGKLGNLRINILHGKLEALKQGGYPPGGRCKFGNGEWTVTPSGNVYPCERIAGEDDGGKLCMGNVFDDRLKPPVKAEESSLHSECLRCDYRNYCVNWCGCVNHQCTGNYRNVGALQCSHEKILIDIARELLYSSKNPTFS